MRENRATLEVIAPSIEEAVEKGLSDLGLTYEDVEVEVLDQGSKGLFGLGSRHARIRLTVKGAVAEAVARVEPALEESMPVEAQPRPEDPEPEIEAEPVGISEQAYEAVSAGDEPPLSLGDDNDLQVAQATVSELLDKMKVRARVSARYGETDRERGRTPIYVEVRGDDLSILIGRRAETLNALQYLSMLIVNKELGRSVSLVIDIEGYRSRREGQLRQLARKMAEQAVKTGRRQILEPMPASERRIIHMELRGNSAVTTESVGEEPRRKITIIPKE